MPSDFFQHNDYRAFLGARFVRLKAVKPQASARWLAQRSGVSSASYFGLVVKGRRNLSLDYAERFAVGLELSDFERDCLVTAVRFDQENRPRERGRLAEKLAKLKSSCADAPLMGPDQAQILSDPLNLKLYLLAQSKAFRFSAKWLRRQMPSILTEKDLDHRVEDLLRAGLWEIEGDGIKVLAPKIRTGDAAVALEQTHKNLLAEVEHALFTQSHERRVLGGRTFLFDPRRLAEVARRIDAFKRDLEAEFESLDSVSAYQLHIAFFDLCPGDEHAR